MRQKCEECGIFNICNDDGICGDCQYEMLDEIDSDDFDDDWDYGDDPNKDEDEDLV